LALAQAARAEQISVTVETSGYGETEDLLSLVPYCDFFLFDCKASSEEHKMLTGVTDEKIVKNLSALCQVGASIILRCPMVEGANLHGALIQKIIALSKDQQAIKSIQLMPYHSAGLEKSSVLGKFPQKQYKRPSEESLHCIAKEIESNSGTLCFF
jgi:pyruvate formate lyase activating enzyme